MESRSLQGDSDKEHGNDLLESAPQLLQPHTQIAFEDLSGNASSTAQTSTNPYDALISSCNNDAKAIQTRYATHRTTRNAQQTQKLLSPDFPGVLVDPILRRLHDLSTEPNNIDPRHCLVLWARPPLHIRTLIAEIQSRLVSLAPKLWFMPPDSLHMTALEITHSRTAPEIASIIDTAMPAAPRLANWTAQPGHRARLVNPMISFDSQALALSFLPAAGELPLTAGRVLDEDDYTYHHLRRDLQKAAAAAGLDVGSRYVVPSAHVTIARFIDGDEFGDADGKVKMSEFIDGIEAGNAWLRRLWVSEEGDVTKDAVQWVVGEEKGLDFRAGTLWYGGGRSVLVGKGFE